jgi:hypothetical protein
MRLHYGQILLMHSPVHDAYQEPFKMMIGSRLVRYPAGYLPSCAWLASLAVFQAKTL